MPRKPSPLAYILRREPMTPSSAPSSDMAMILALNSGSVATRHVKHQRSCSFSQNNGDSGNNSYSTNYTWVCLWCVHVIIVEMKRPMAPKAKAVAKLSSCRTMPRVASCASLAAFSWSKSACWMPERNPYRR